jgi:dTDP-4-amino-4,6-dideoxygalactose transaminase
VRVPLRASDDDPIWVGRGTTALCTFLASLGGTGGQVLVPVNVCEIAVAGIQWSGYTPRFHDVNPRSGNAELCHLEEAFTQDCVAMLAVHNYGTPVPARQFRSWADEHRLLMVEDVCNALGATSGGRLAGEFGHAAIFSFGHGKIIDAGVGGALTVIDEQQRQRCREIAGSMPRMTDEHLRALETHANALREARRSSGAAAKIYAAAFDSLSANAHFRLPDATVETIGASLDNLAATLESRAGKAREYARLLPRGVVTPRPTVAGEVFWRYTFLVSPDCRDQVVLALREAGLHASCWYQPIHTVFPGAEPESATAEFPGAAQFGAQVINLWVDDSIRSDDIQLSSEIVRRVAGA